MILVVDDHADTRLLLQRLLKLFGYPTQCVADGMAAVEMLAVQKPTLVITDFHMPLMNGLTLFRHMRADPRYANIPVIFFSAVEGRIRERALTEGVAAWIVKGSLDFADLKPIIERYAGPARVVSPPQESAQNDCSQSA